MLAEQRGGKLKVIGTALLASGAMALGVAGLYPFYLYEVVEGVLIPAFTVPWEKPWESPTLIAGHLSEVVGNILTWLEAALGSIQAITGCVLLLLSRRAIE